MDPAAASESITQEHVETSTSNTTGETGQPVPGALAQLTACYRETSDGDDDDDDDRC